MNRRKLLGTTCSLGFVLLAGCSSEDSPGETVEAQNQTTMSESTTEGTTTTTDETATPQKETSNQQTSADQVLKYEEQVEEYFSQRVGASWVEIEDTSVGAPSPYETEIAEIILNESGGVGISLETQEYGVGVPELEVGELDTVYIGVIEAEDNDYNEPFIIIGGLDESEWNPSNSANENRNNNQGLFMETERAEVSEDMIAEFLEKDVESYDDISEEFPEKYRQYLE